MNTPTRAIFKQIRCHYSKFVYTASMAPPETKHLQKGDPQPPLKKGFLRLYSMKFCPYAQRVRLVLDAKKVQYDTVNANLSQKPEWLFEKSDGAKVPVIEFEDGQLISESLIVSDFLDEAYPETPLYPRDPKGKAKDRMLIEKISGVTSIFFKLITGGLNDETFEELIVQLENFEKELTKRGTPFFNGSKPGMVDFMIWPWAERAPLLVTKGGPQYKLPENRLPKLTTWCKSMVADDAVKVSYLTPAVHTQFMASRKEGVYDFEYDNLTSNM